MMKSGQRVEYFLVEEKVKEKSGKDKSANHGQTKLDTVN